MSAGGPQLVTAAGDPANGPKPGEGDGEEFVREVTLTIKYNLDKKMVGLNVDPPEIRQHRDILYAALDLAHERVVLLAVQDMLTAAASKKRVLSPDDLFYR